MITLTFQKGENYRNETFDTELKAIRAIKALYKNNRRKLRRSRENRTWVLQGIKEDGIKIEGRESRVAVFANMLYERDSVNEITAAQLEKAEQKVMALDRKAKYVDIVKLEKDWQ